MPMFVSAHAQCAIVPKFLVLSDSVNGLPGILVGEGTFRIQVN